MKIVFHERFTEVYSTDPASQPGRMEAIMKELTGLFDVVEPQMASYNDLLLAHSKSHIERIKKDHHVFEIASLSAGGAILCAKIAKEGEPSFGVIRPPGHHAGYDSHWGFCYFNNIAIAIKKLMSLKEIESALIVDFDLHFGDGTANIFKKTKEVTYYHVPGGDRINQLKSLEQFLEKEKTYSILAVSAGFDRAKKDWGGTLEIEDYSLIGELLKNASERICRGLRFAVLEGGYNHSVLGKNVLSFIEGFK
ncbi:MAG: histone deacetylase family protein [Desulfobacterota bacterium]|nr:histone deacetylase family protein [Thermodesulfobacteriota bacterium]MDW8001131.1 histone deacetylase family protein [Deltaproteobacteria bacterium]